MYIIKSMSIIVSSREITNTILKVICIIKRNNIWINFNLAWFWSLSSRTRTFMILRKLIRSLVLINTKQLVGLLYIVFSFTVAFLSYDIYRYINHFRLCMLSNFKIQMKFWILLYTIFKYVLFTIFFFFLFPSIIYI